MALTFDATVGGAAANSYVTQAQVIAYLEGRFDADAWVEMDSGDRNKILVMATSRLDLESYVGTTVTTTQRLQWPRYGALDRNGEWFSSTAIPRCVQEATAELALVILKDPDFLNDTGLEGFEHISIGPLDLTPTHTQRAGTLPLSVLRLLRDVRLVQFDIVRG